jgi:ABC-2 type transport system ATP-binding protein
MVPIRALLGIYQASSGNLLVNNKIFSPEDGATLGYLPEERGLYKKESVIDVMSYFGALKGMTKRAAKEWSLNYLQRVGIEDKATTRLDKLSGGQQQKVQLGVTIMNDPSLLILDEPTKGFDPVNRRLLMDIIDEQRKKGATVMLVTHQMEEVERLCDRIILLKDGGIAAYGSVQEVKQQFGAAVIAIEYSGTLPTSRFYTISKKDSKHAEITLTSKIDEALILKELVETKGLAIRSFTSRTTSLDDIFIELYGKDFKEEK